MSLWTSNQSLQRSAAYQELVQTLEEPGCPICTIAQKQVRSHIGGILWDSVNDPGFRNRIDASLGLCNRHTREMLTFTGERLAISIVQQAVVKTAIHQLRNRPPSPRRSWLHLLRNRIQPWLGNPDAPNYAQPASTPADDTADATADDTADATGPNIDHASDLPTQAQTCPACELEARTEARVSEVLIRHLENDLDAPLAKAGGLCRPHLYFCLARSPETEHTALIELHEQLWTALANQLGEFIRKRDHRFRHETVTDEERDAVERSVHIITGGDPLYPSRKDTRR